MGLKNNIYNVVSLLLWFSMAYAAYIDSTNADDDLVVQLANPVGKIRGHILKSQNGYDFFAFQDIPYAQPPTGTNRLKLPMPVNGWDGILDTTSNKVICIQKPSSSFSNKGLTESEDCLVLNVYTPVKPGTSTNLPVYFWIHHGHFVEGSGAITNYNPKYFMDNNIVVVTLNYRLGPLGFLTTNDDIIPGNLGLKDQHLALKWVSQNIQLFGGDPNHVVIGGQDAGAISVGYHLLSKQNQGLFKAAIQESGSALTIFGFQTGFRDHAFEFGRRVNSSFNTNNNAELLNYLQIAPLPEILRVQLEFKSNERIGYLNGEFWTPIVEDAKVTDALITGPMREDFEKGNFNQVPVLLGFTSEESLTGLAATTDEAYNNVVGMFDRTPALMTSDKLNVAQKNKATAGREVKAVYTSGTFVENKTAFVRFSSDTSYTRSVLRQAEITSQFVPVYLYQLSSDGGIINLPGTGKTGHGTDLAYFWDTPLQPAPKIDESIRKALFKLWINFIKEQNPTPAADAELQNIIWPKTQPATLEYLDIDESFSLGKLPRQYKEVKEILDKYLQYPLNVY